MEYQVEPYREPTMQCVLESAARRKVAPHILLAIGQHEAGREGSAFKNTDGSLDFGRTGINSVHLVELAQYGVHPQVASYYLRYDGCYSYEMAAFLIQRHLAQCKKDFWSCVANFHSKTPSKNRIYQTKIIPLANAWERYLRANYPQVYRSASQ